MTLKWRRETDDSFRATLDRALRKRPSTLAMRQAEGLWMSACLDFADLVRRLPGVIHVGQPTSADAIYIDNTYQELPSRLAGVGYSMKKLSFLTNHSRRSSSDISPSLAMPSK